MDSIRLESSNEINQKEEPKNQVISWYDLMTKLAMTATSIMDSKTCM